ncbi:MAG: SLC13 family permease [Candidatus Nezhaarchaeota archaeon]|nr:SLC13 family permease [Candidatus Nezhaarchaeota archaeon]
MHAKLDGTSMMPEDLFNFVIGLGVLSFLIFGMVLRSRRPKTPIWSIMAFSAFVIVISGLTPIESIAHVMDFDVILFLIGMFSIVAVAESSGLLDSIAHLVLSRFKGTYTMLIFLSLTMGLLSSIAVNDTVALMGPPIVYSIAKSMGINPKPLFLLLAFSITIGSTTTPIGNPQNMLIAINSGMKCPFIDFVKYLSIPTIINLIVTALIVAKVYKLNGAFLGSLNKVRSHINNIRDALVASVLLIAVIVFLVVNDVMALLGLPHIENRGFIPFMVAAGGYLLVSNPRDVLRRVDWGTIVFFMTMFITMSGVWRSGVLNSLLSLFMPSKNTWPFDYFGITACSLVLSQLLSNVPFTKLFLDYMKTLGYTPSDVNSWITLAMASTIAGNLTLLGAASNIIIIEVLESRYGETISFKEFSKIGMIVTLVNIAVYTIFILLLT